MIIYLLLHETEGSITEIVSSSKCQGNSGWLQYNDLNFQILHKSAFQWRTEQKGVASIHPKNPQAWANLSGVHNKPQVVLGCWEPKYFLLFLIECKFVSRLSCSCLCLLSKTPQGPLCPNFPIMRGFGEKKQLNLKNNRLFFPNFGWEWWDLFYKK